MAGESLARLGDDSLQYLCSKYSSLISRLREEVQFRQKAESQARLLDRRLREEFSAREAERRQWEDERHFLREEILGLRAIRKDTEDMRNVEAVELRRSEATSAQLSERCDRLHEVCVEEQKKSMQIMDQATAGSEVLIRQGEELTRLRNEHSKLLTQNHEANSELAVVREQLARSRRQVVELEAKVNSATTSCDDAETHTRQLQEELRQALRAVSLARSREAAASHCAGRGEKELRSRDARLDAVRREGRAYAKRATSAERRLAVAESYEAMSERVVDENNELQRRLLVEARACEGARLEVARTEASELRATASAGEALSELHAKDALALASQQRVVQLEGEMTHLHARLETLEGERLASGSSVEGLRGELRAVCDEREESRRERDKLLAELGDSRRRIDRGAPQLAECRRRLSGAEDSLARARAEVSEERRARERCHVEAIRSGEKLRMTKSQCNQLRERVRALEEAELRYPSRHRKGHDSLLPFDAWVADSVDDAVPNSGVDDLGLAISKPRWPPPSAMEQPAALTTPVPRAAARLPPSPVLHQRGAGQGTTGSKGDIEAVRDFVAQEEQRLTSLGIGADTVKRCNSSPSIGGVGAFWDGVSKTATPTADCRSEGCTGGSNAADSEIARLLASQPRVLRLPETLQ